jgi:hypothetical protein
MIQLPKQLQYYSHSHSNSFNQRRSSASSAVTAAMSVHHSGLLLLFTSSFQHVAFVCPNRSQCSHLILFCWGQSLNPAFNAGPTPFNAQTAFAFVNQTGKCFLSPLNFGICFKLTESMVQTFRFLSAFFSAYFHVNCY